VSFDSQPELGRHGPQALRALAHPLRLDILERLTVHGPMTATDLGTALAESPANCSWHLRKLAEHGLVEPSGDGQGRSRPWRVTASVGGSAAGTAPHDRVQQLLAQVLIDREVARFGANRAQAAGDAWDDVQVANQAVDTVQGAANAAVDTAQDVAAGAAQVAGDAAGAVAERAPGPLGGVVGATAGAAEALAGAVGNQDQDQDQDDPDSSEDQSSQENER
jgi:DNA-binding transcriptional ArsR family regulator